MAQRPEFTAPCCTASRPDAGFGGARPGAWALRLVLGRPDLQELRGAEQSIAAATCRWTGCWWRRTHPILAPEPQRGKKQRAGLCVAHTAARASPRFKRPEPRKSWRVRPRRRTSCGSSRRSPRAALGCRRAARPHDASPDDPGLRHVRLVRRASDGHWGACDPEQSEEYPAAAARRCWSSALLRRGETDIDPGGHLARPAQAAPGCRQVGWVDARALQPRSRRPHPRHRRPARFVGFNGRRRVDIYADPQHGCATLQGALRLLLRDAARQRTIRRSSIPT